MHRQLRAEEPAEVNEATETEAVQADSDHAENERDLSGITAEGRAINDPRVDARPVGKIKVQTAIASVFGAEAFPDAPHLRARHHEPQMIPEVQESMSLRQMMN